MADSLPRVRALRPRPQPTSTQQPPQMPQLASLPSATSLLANEGMDGEITEDERDGSIGQDQGGQRVGETFTSRKRRREDSSHADRYEEEGDEHAGQDVGDGDDEEEQIGAPVEVEKKEDVVEADADADATEKKLVVAENYNREEAPDRESERKIYECPTCTPVKILPNLRSYLYHLKREHKQRVRCYECPHCEFVCQHAKKLQRHFRVAHEDLQDKVAKQSAERSRCPMCAHVAANQRDLETHQRVNHLKRRFFRCSKCSYVTHVRARYTKHVKYHSMPMIKCDACDFRTPYKWNLDRHTRNHGGGGAFQCRACNFTADIRQSLTVHEMNHHDPPVGQPHRKATNPCERKPRNSPKRYNQVGASDFREEIIKPNTKRPNSSTSKILPEDERNEIISGAECIALKCEEKACQFVTSWDSEMQRHLAEAHAPAIPAKPKKPLPMLIPLGGNSTAKVTSSNSNCSTTLLRVPKVRVRPELAQIARDSEMARLYSEQENVTTKSQQLQQKRQTTSDTFERKNASFFDKLKERLMSSGNRNHGNGVGKLEGNSGNQVVADLKCWCTFEAKDAMELASHRRTHHAALSVSLGTSRCPKCRRRCKSSTDLQIHLNNCQVNEITNDLSTSSDQLEIYNDDRPTSVYRGEYTFPFQMEWESSAAALNSSGSSVESGSTQQSGRRVFKCPHCAFWASTASRFHVHIVGHLNRKPFECSLCSYRSNWRWDITKHIKLKAARDPAHTTARVLMTDETGRRNYSKYNKYLAQVHHQQQLQISNERLIDGPPNKVLATDNSEYRQLPELTPAPISIDIIADDVETLPARPPPPLKAATRSQGQSLLKNSPSSWLTANKTVLSITPSSSSLPIGIDDAKRTLWKCKRCNFRDSKKENVLAHVKSHYEDPSISSDPEKKSVRCSDCPYIASSVSLMAKHRVHHQPNLEAIFKCYLCPFYVSTKAELLDHARLHGEELATEHQRNIETDDTSSTKKKFQCSLQVQLLAESGFNMKTVDELSQEDIVRVSPSPVSRATSPKSKASDDVAPPLLLDTRALPDAPLVWVSRPDGSLAKMLKCRHCPHIASRRAEVRDHESMHISPPSQGPLIRCSDCNFICTRRDVMESHDAMHAGTVGTVHCLVDEGRSDAQQLNDLSTLLGLAESPTLGTEPDLRDTRLVHCCGKCPARFLCEKELRIHLRYHSTELAYSCQWCSYAARQPAHLLAHQKAHSPEYQERTRYLLSLYGYSQRYPPPTTACVEANNHSSVAAGIGGVAWIVVEINSGPGASNGHGNGNIGSPQENVPRVFNCSKCPSRYFKLEAYEYHMTLHGTNNRFKCTECDYSSGIAQNLVKHQGVHKRHAETLVVTVGPTVRAPGGPPPDPQFGVLMRGNPNFVYPGYLRNGRMKEKRYKCHKCPSAFEKREQYRVHLTLHGAKQRYRCDTCDYSVKYYANYVQHLKKHQANAEAQASKRQYEDDAMSIDSDVVVEAPVTIPLRSAKSLSKSSNISGPIANSSSNVSHLPLMTPAISGIIVSNQDKQSLMLMQKKSVMQGVNELEIDSIRCQSCPFGTPDKDAMDAHKRRHGIERMTPPCPHCDYVPRKDENASDHVRLHFTRLYKPESYLIAELLTLTVRSINDAATVSSLDERKKAVKDDDGGVLFKESADGKFLPALAAAPSLSLAMLDAKSSTTHSEKVIVDPNTGETKQTVATSR